MMPIPSEERWKASEKRRIAGVMRRRKGLPEEDGSRTAGEGDGRAGAVPATTMFDQVICKSIVPTRNAVESSTAHVQLARKVWRGWNAGLTRGFGRLYVYMRSTYVCTSERR